MQTRNPNELPPDIWMHVFSFLKPKELCNLELVSTETKALASDNAVWKAATGYTKTQFRNPSKMLFSIFNISDLEVKVSSVNSYIVPAKAMEDAIMDLKKRKPSNSLSWQNQLYADKFVEPILLTTQQDEIMAYRKRFFEALLGTISCAYTNYFMLKFRLMGDDMIKIYSYQHCMAGFKNIMTYKPDTEFNLIDLQTPITVSVGNFPAIRAEWREKPSHTVLFATNTEKAATKPGSKERKLAAPPTKKSSCSIS